MTGVIMGGTAGVFEAHGIAVGGGGIVPIGCLAAGNHNGASVAAGNNVAPALAGKAAELGLASLVLSVGPFSWARRSLSSRCRTPPLPS